VSKRPYVEYINGLSEHEALDRFLQTTKSIPDDLWWDFDNAIGYDAAASVGWASGRLKTLYLRIENGESISVPVVNAVLNKETFEPIISEHFSPFMYRHIVEDAIRK